MIQKLREFLGGNGTSVTNTAPNASQPNAFYESRFRQLMASARTAMEAEPHMPKLFWSHAVLDAADKGNYLAIAKQGKIQPSPRAHIQKVCPEYKMLSPAAFLQ